MEKIRVSFFLSFYNALRDLFHKIHLDIVACKRLTRIRARDLIYLH